MQRENGMALRAAIDDNKKSRADEVVGAAKKSALAV